MLTGEVVMTDDASLVVGDRWCNRVIISFIRLSIFVSGVGNRSNNDDRDEKDKLHENTIYRLGGLVSRVTYTLYRTGWVSFRLR